MVRLKPVSRQNQQKTSKSAPNERTKQSIPSRSVGKMPQKLDLSKQKKPDETAIVKIRDPITSKLRTIYLNDEQIDVLSRRHQAEKDLVDKTIINKNSKVHYSAQKVEKPRQPIDIKDTQVLIDNNQNFENRTAQFEIPVKTEVPRNQAEIDPPVFQYQKFDNIADDNFDKLLERHKQEKNLVEQYENTYESEAYRSNDNQFEVFVE